MRATGQAIFQNIYNLFLLTRGTISSNNSGMIDKTDLSKAQTIRLRASHWAKLRALMQFHGNRKWLEKCIDREHKKVFGVSPKKES